MGDMAQSLALVGAVRIVVSDVAAKARAEMVVELERMGWTIDQTGECVGLLPR